MAAKIHLTSYFKTRAAIFLCAFSILFAEISEPLLAKSEKIAISSIRQKPKAKAKSKAKSAKSAKKTTASKSKKSLKTAASVGSSRVDLQACKLEYSIVSPK